MTEPRVAPLVEFEDSQEEETSEHGTRASTPASANESRGDAWVTSRNPIGEVTSLISSLYISDPEEPDQGDVMRETPLTSHCLLSHPSPQIWDQ